MPRPAEGPPPRLRYADGALDPATWSAAVATAVDRIDAGDLAKVVLARDLLVSADGPLDPRRLLRRLADRFPDCWTFAVDGLLGATPELLLRRSGRHLSARVLAGTAPRGAGAADERLAAALIDSAKDRAEHALAVDSLVRALEPYCATLDAPDGARAAHPGQRAAPGQRRHRDPAAPRVRAAGPVCWSWSGRCTRPRRSAAPRPRTPPR